MTDTMFTGKRVLISGASGFIGSHLAKSIQSMGGEVSAIVHKTPVLNFDALYICDLVNLSDVIEIVNICKPDFVFHLAAQAIVSVGQEDARRTLDTNIIGSLNLLQALSMCSHKPMAVVCASTDKVFGRHKVLPYTEDFSLLGTRQVYETSKHCEDILAQMAAHSWGLPIGITRFGNVYGPGDFHFNRIVPETLKAFCTNSVLNIRSNGQHYRDFIYIDDVVDGYIALADFVAKHPQDAPHIFNFGTGIPSRVLDIVSMIRENFPKSKNPNILWEAKDEINRQYVCADKAYESFGWKPQVKLRDGILTTVEWYKNYFGVL